jgi:hypothetical protein
MYYLTKGFLDTYDRNKWGTLVLLFRLKKKHFIKLSSVLVTRYYPRVMFPRTEYRYVGIPRYRIS